MSELRHLFALMVSSQRKYVDPSKAVDILKEAFAATAATGVGDSQQVNNRL
jgi:ubiquitin carboxyl-terminal hydrolase 25/28